MNMTTRNALLLAACALAPVLSACQQQADAAPPLAGASIGGPFTLTDQNGRRISDTAFAGKYRLMYFGFTYCPDICPVDLQTIGTAMRQLEGDEPEIAAKVQPIFITVDPARDTPDVMRRYVAAFHPRLVGLTGTEQEIAQVARRFGVFHNRGDEANGQYLVNHSRIVFLFGPDGAPIAIVPHDQGPAAMAAEIERWVR